MSKAMRVLSRNVPTFSITFIASLPNVLLFNRDGNPALGWIFGAFALSIQLSALSQAIVLYGAFEAMRGRRVDLVASFQHAWRRFLPVIGAGLFFPGWVGVPAPYRSGSHLGHDVVRRNTGLCGRADRPLEEPEAK
jgi:hypothetical protein